MVSIELHINTQDAQQLAKEIEIANQQLAKGQGISNKEAREKILKRLSNQSK